MFEDGSRSLDRLSILQYRQDGNDSDNSVMSSSLIHSIEYELKTK